MGVWLSVARPSNSDCPLMSEGLDTFSREGCPTTLISLFSEPWARGKGVSWAGLFCLLQQLSTLHLLPFPPGRRRFELFGYCS